MGQEQSFHSKTRNLSLDGTTQHSAHRRRSLSDQHSLDVNVSPMINRIHSAIDIRHDLTFDGQERPRTSSEQGNEEGIVYVAKSSAEHQDPLLAKLQQLEPVRPLIKDSDRPSFGLESLFDLGSAGMKVLSGKESMSSVSRSSSIKTNDTDTIASARMDPLVDIILTLQLHINNNMAKVNLNQKRLLQRSKHVDDLSLKATQAINVALTQSRIASDRLNEAKHIKNQAKQTRYYATTIFESLSRIQHLLDPEDRVGHAEFEKRWPVLHTLHQRASNKNGRPPVFLPSCSASNTNNKQNDSTQQQQQQQKTSTATATTTINLATMTPSSLSSSEIPTAPASLIPPLSSSSQETVNQQQQQQNGNSSTLAMDRLRSLVGDSTTTTDTDGTLGDIICENDAPQQHCPGITID